MIIEISILGKGATDRLEDTISTVEAEYSTNFSKRRKKCCLSLHYNESYQFKTKYSEKNTYPWCLGNIFKRFYN